jgi:hypothetical protein
MEQSNHSSKNLCASCIKAQVYEDLGMVEEVYYHCYESNCSCGCFNKTPQAVKTMISLWSQGQKMERQALLN